MPKALIFCFEPGVNALDNIYAQPITSWKDFKIAVKQLERPAVQEKFDFCAFDTIDIAYELAEQWVCAQNGWSEIREGAYGRGYDLLKKEFSGVFRQIAQLGYGLMFISHDTEKVLKDAKGQEYTQIVPAAPPRARDIINKLVDFIIYIGQEDDPETKTLKRVMYLRGNDRILAGSRFQYVPEKIPLSYDAFVKTVGEAIDAAAKVSGLTTTNEKDAFYNKESGLSFEELFKKTEKLWGDILAKDQSDKVYNDLMDIVEKSFGARIKLSSTTEKQRDMLELTYLEMEQYFQSM